MWEVASVSIYQAWSSWERLREWKTFSISFVLNICLHTQEGANCGGLKNVGLKQKYFKNYNLKIFFKKTIVSLSSDTFELSGRTFTKSSNKNHD